MLDLAKDLPKALRGDHYPLGGAFVLALPEDRPVGLERYEVVASFVPDLEGSQYRGVALTAATAEGHGRHATTATT